MAGNTLDASADNSEDGAWFFWLAPAWRNASLNPVRSRRSPRAMCRASSCLIPSHCLLRARCAAASPRTVPSAATCSCWRRWPMHSRRCWRITAARETAGTGAHSSRARRPAPACHCGRPTRCTGWRWRDLQLLAALADAQQALLEDLTPQQREDRRHRRAHSSRARRPAPACHCGRPTRCNWMGAGATGCARCASTVPTKRAYRWKPGGSCNASRLLMMRGWMHRRMRCWNAMTRPRSTPSLRCW